MTNKEVFLSHLVDLARQKEFIALVNDTAITNEMRNELEGQIKQYEDRLGRIYNFALYQGLEGFDPTTTTIFELFRDKLLGMKTERGSSTTALDELSGHLQQVDMLAFKVATLGTRFLVLVDGDRLSPASLKDIARSLSAIGDVLLARISHQN